MGRRWNAKAQRAKTKQAGQRNRNRHRALAKERRYRESANGWEARRLAEYEQSTASGATR